MDIRSLHTIETAEQTRLEIELAGIGNRVFAFLIDMVMMLILLVFGVFLVLNLKAISTDLVKTGLILLPFLVFNGYHLIQEWLWNGRSLGKAILGIRVVRDNGQPIGFWESAGRNLFRLIDIAMAGVGMIPMMISRREKRFGDFLVGTLVVNDQKLARPGVYRPEWSEPQNTADTDLNHQQADVQDWDTLVKRLSPEEMDWLSGFLASRQQWSQAHRKALAQSMCEYLCMRFYLDAAMLASGEEALEQLYLSAKSMAPQSHWKRESVQ